MTGGAQVEPQDDRAKPDEPVRNGFIFSGGPASALTVRIGAGHIR
jgi:hypothetical protein